MANHSICTYGTFGLWGALLGQQGEVVIPKAFKSLDIMQGEATGYCCMGDKLEAAFPNWKYM